MKKLMFITLAAVALSSASTFAADSAGMRSGGYGLAGCGLGSMVWEKNTKLQQILAATTNGTFGTQTFGITTGTSNCNAHGMVRQDKAAEMFVATNYENLIQDMSRGKGETLVAFSGLMGCSKSASFGKATQAKFENVYGKTSTPEELLGAVKSELASDADYQNSCR